MTCPLLELSIHRVRQHIENRLSSVLYEDTIERLYELEKVAQHADDSDASKRLRAFYCVEHLQRLAARKINQSLSAIDVRSSRAEVLLNFRFPKSHIGLTKLINALDELEREIVVENAELRVTGQLQSTDVLHLSALNSSEKIITVARDAARLLRAELRDPVGREMHRIGSMFLLTLFDYKYSPSEVTQHISKLISITPTSTYVIEG